MLHLFIYTALSHISAITQPRRGLDLLWSGNVSISFGTRDQALYGTLTRRTMSYLDSRTHNVQICFFAQRKLLLQFIFCLLQYTDEMSLI